MRKLFGYGIDNWSNYMRRDTDMLFAFCIAPSKRFTQIWVYGTKTHIAISNNMFGQLGPEALYISFRWRPRMGYFNSLARKV